MTEPVPPNRYVYWVVYKTNDITGGRRIFSSEPADTKEWVDSVCRWLAEQNLEYGDILLLNWIRLAGDEVWEHGE